MLVMVLASMEQTITSTAMPTIIGAPDGLKHYSWVASIYLLACTVSMPLYGRMADAFGRKRVILFAISLFLISSLLAATAQSMIQLIVYRGLQGFGAGGIMPVVLTILGDIFTIEERARVQGYFSAVWGIASLAGPALGWLLLVTLGWRSIFFVNIPAGLIAMFVLMRHYHDHEKSRSVYLDLVGAAALAVACMALLLLVSRLGPGGWSVNGAIALTALAGAAAIFFVKHERTSPDPIMPMDLWTNRAIGPSLIGSCLLGIGFLSLDTFVPLYVQGGRGGGPGAAAWVVTPVMLTWALSGIFAAPALVRWGFRRTAMFGSILVVVGFAGLLICAAADAPRSVLGVVLAITGFGFGPCSMSYLIAAQNAVSWQRRGLVTGSVQFFRTMGGAVGIGVLARFFNILTLRHLGDLESKGISPAALLDPHLRSQIPSDILLSAGKTIASGLNWVFVAMLVIAVIQIFITALMPGRSTSLHISKLEMAEALGG